MGMLPRWYHYHVDSFSDAQFVYQKPSCVQNDVHPNAGNIYVFKRTNINTWKRCEIVKVNNKDTRTTILTSLWCLYCELWRYLAYFSTVSIVHFEQVNVCTLKEEEKLEACIKP